MAPITQKAKKLTVHLPLPLSVKTDIGLVLKIGKPR